MSIEQTNKIDFISTDKNDVVVLTISDHLLWDAKNKHLLVLQEKLNNYLRFVESGEIFEVYPNARGRKIAIQIVAKHLPNSEGNIFLSRAQKAVEGAGFLFKLVVTDDSRSA